MKKIYKLVNLGCANCAAKMGEEISKMECVDSAKVNFMLSKLTLEFEDESKLPSKDQIEKVIKSIENYCRLA